MTNSPSAQLGFLNSEKNAMSLQYKVDEQQELKLSYHFNKYFEANVVLGSRHTFLAKRKDIQDFLKFYLSVVPSDMLILWTPSISKGYIEHMKKSLRLKATTINRKLATLRHAVSWMEKKGFFKEHSPFENVSDLKLGVIAWKGLSDLEIMRLKSACDKLMAASIRSDQDPLLYTAVFYVLLYTGLRESELCDLDYAQYNGKYFSYVQRKGNKITEKMPVPIQAREFLDKYIATRGEISPDAPLLLNNRGNRLTHDNVYYICTKIKKQANAFLPPEQHCQFSPHSLRHAFLKRVADKMGIHAAQELSGNVSLKEIYRYTRPSFEETEAKVEDLF